MKKNLEGGYGHWVVTIIGIILILALIGFFKAGTQNTLSQITYKTILRLPCGLTVQAPNENGKVLFPLTVKGYVNGCGWQAQNGSAGTVQVFDETGALLTAQTNLVVPPDSSGMPYYFESTLQLLAAPHTDTGSVIIHGVTGLSDAIPVRF